MSRKRSHFLACVVSIALAIYQVPASACTGISLSSEDGGVIVARTVEWALGDAKHNQIVIFPRGKVFRAQTPDGLNGMSWKGRFGLVSVAAYDQPFGPDAMNERGLYVGAYYFPGYADYKPYDKAYAHKSMSVGDFMQWLLSSFESVEEVRKNLDKVRVVDVKDPRFGGVPLPFHWKIADATGASIVVEIVNGGEIKVYDTFRGVVANSPSYDWHLTNLRNYLNLSAQPAAPLVVDGKSVSPFGSGSGLVGLPGDFTPPSRFVRASLFTATVRPLPTTADAVFEAFRILDSFNIPVGLTAKPEKISKEIASATQITTAADLKNRRYYFHTMDNREIRMIDFSKIDFSTVKEQMIDIDEGQRNRARELSVPAQKAVP
ncbi:MAG: linear amide C-N hydrolase [Acidovorax sp.]|jgi:choloylglycine hydrolase